MGYNFCQMKGRYLTFALMLSILVLSGCTGGVRTKEVEGGPAGPPEEAPQTSLPAPSETRDVDVKPVEEPTPPEIGYYEAARQISRLYPPELQPLTVKGRIAIILHDLDEDRHPECLSLGLPSRGISSQEVSRIGDSSRLFEEGSEPIPFYLIVFANDEGNFRRIGVLDLGEHVVFEYFQGQKVFSNRTVPLVVTTSFQTVEGREVELSVFDGAEAAPRYRQTLVETLSTQYELKDIDGNGMIDLFVKEKAIEEGTGFETFLTWYRWNGRDFAEYQSINVVRNLNTFLAKTTELLVAGEAREIVGFLVEPARLGALKRRGWSDHKILIHTLGLEGMGIEEFPSLREVVFPLLLEDPFITEDELGSSFEITYRMIDQSGNSYISRARLYMPGNPFGDRQFAFSPNFD
jgi:hypothetical protein